MSEDVIIFIHGLPPEAFVSRENLLRARASNGTQLKLVPTKRARGVSDCWDLERVVQSEEDGADAARAACKKILIEKLSP